MRVTGSTSSQPWPEPGAREIDPLTGVLTLGYARRVIDSFSMRRGPEACTLALIHINIDYFAYANHAHGHRVGDAVLAAVAAQIAFAAGPSRCVSRVGGDKFLIIVPGGSQADALDLAEAIRQRVSQTSYTVSDKNVPPLTVSAGVVAFPATGRSANELLEAADDACYGASVGGRNRVYCGTR